MTLYDKINLLTKQSWIKKMHVQEFQPIEQIEQIGFIELYWLYEKFQNEYNA